ncbi:MAG: hypothetical protein CMF50_01250 [Legionellales bacterium]|nr:hypothetical protein [Legionellales bacterium]|tara:strand:+ start:2550 stop:2828 length:279 start_codon:yes stop_codon:yes gene_type:complete
MKETVSLPDEVARAILYSHQHPIAAWRTFYGLSEDYLCQELGIGIDTLRKLESSNLHRHPAWLSQLKEIFGVVPEAIDIEYNNYLKQGVDNG